MEKNELHLHDLTDTEIGTLDDFVPPVERVIDGDTTRLVKKEVVLLHLEPKGGYDFSFAEIPNDFANPIPLYGESGQLIGSASVYFSDDVIFADLFFDYSSPDRLTIETKAYPLYANLSATVYIQAQAVRLDGQTLFPTCEEVFAIFPETVRLTTQKPADERLTPIE